MRSSEDRWKIGDDALKAEPIGRKGPRGGVVDRLEEMARELGIPAKTLRTCRGVAKAWPKKQRRTSLSWSVHSTLRGQPDRFTLIREYDWTVEEAQELVRSRLREKAQ